MRKEKTLIKLMHRFLDLVAEESARNSEFSAKLESLFFELPEKKTSSKNATKSSTELSLPDIHAEWNSRGETDFRLWLRDQPIPVLRGIIRIEDIDATRRTTKWKEAEKLAGFIADSLRARQSRGSAFIGSKAK